jgi:hypothetical protein
VTVVQRAQFGKRGGVYGCWVSKPGFDVLTCSPGDFLVDTSSQVFQSILRGDSLIVNEGAAAIGAGTYSVSVGLPASVAGFSQLMMMATYYMVQNNGTLFPAQNINNTYLSFTTSGGVLFLRVTFRNAGGTGTASVTFEHRAAYTIFRGQF